ncbi:MAG TPA: M36 family metallopeptidase, partial [Ferruginibacter sp.]|nr:M36 family metallopeptidase [Ferruginibacter sp.]
EMVYKNQQAIGLTDADIRNSVISDTYFNRTSGTRLVYLQQTYLDIPVYNQILTLSFKDGRLVYKSGQRILGIEKKVNVKTGIPTVMAEQAVHAALRDRKLLPTQAAEAQQTDAGGRFIRFNNMGVSREPITANLMWVPVDGNQIKLSWLVYVIPTTSSDYWMVRVDASNQSILGMDNYTVYCNWDAPHKGCNKTHPTVSARQPLNISNTPAAAVTGNSPSIVNDASYLVVPFPVESPNHFGGNPVVVNNPWNAAPGNATSLKWHSDGTTDYNITRGNNVWAKEDRNGTNATTGNPATSTSATSPLQFQFTPNFSAAPTQITPAPNQAFNITNLFYWNNIIH